jgi:hypothetical protein
MGFDRRSFSLTVPNPAATVTENFNARSDYIRPLGFSVLLTGTDALVQLRLTDADSRVCYLDAADKDYKTATIYTTPLATDDVTTGTGPKLYDSVGVLAAATQLGPMPVMKSPIAVSIINGTTAGDVISLTFDYEYGVFGANSFTMPVAAGNTSVFTTNLKSRYAQILGFKAQQTAGASTTVQLEIKDADGRIVYKDAADKDYTTALDKILLLDPTVTGMTRVVPRQNTGASYQAGVGRAELPLVRSPITFTLTNDELNTAVIAATVYYKTA